MPDELQTMPCSLPDGTKNQRSPKNASAYYQPVSDYFTCKNKKYLIFPASCKVSPVFDHLWIHPGFKWCVDHVWFKRNTAVTGNGLGYSGKKLFILELQPRFHWLHLHVKLVSTEKSSMIKVASGGKHMFQWSEQLDFLFNIQIWYTTERHIPKKQKLLMLFSVQIRVRRSSAMLMFDLETAFLKQFHLLCASSWSANPRTPKMPNAYSNALFCTVSPSVTFVAN